MAPNIGSREIAKGGSGGLSRSARERVRLAVRFETTGYRTTEAERNYRKQIYSRNIAENPAIFCAKARKSEWKCNLRKAQRQLAAIGNVPTKEAIQLCDRIEYCHGVTVALGNHLKDIMELNAHGFPVDPKDSKDDMSRMRKNVAAQVKAVQDRRRENCRSKDFFHWQTVYVAWFFENGWVYPEETEGSKMSDSERDEEADAEMNNEAVETTMNNGEQAEVVAAMDVKNEVVKMKMSKDTDVIILDSEDEKGEASNCVADTEMKAIEEEYQKQVAIEEEYRKKVRNQYREREEVPKRVDGKTVEEWADFILGYVLQGTQPVMTLFVAGLLALYPGYTNQTNEWYRDRETVNSWCTSTVTTPVITRPDGTRFKPK